MPNIDIVYVLAGMANTRERVRYRLSKVKYDRNEESRQLCTEIASNILNNIVIMHIYICVMHYIVRIIPIFINY